MDTEFYYYPEFLALLQGMSVGLEACNNDKPVHVIIVDFSCGLDTERESGRQLNGALPLTKICMVLINDAGVWSQ